MRYLLIGALLGLLLLFPQLLTIVAVIIAALLSKPLIVVFGLGVAVGVRMRGRRWAP